MATDKLYLNNIFDKIYCINLKARTDKRKKIEEQAKKFDLEINFFEAVAKPDNPIRGCLESHLELIKLAKNEKLSKILILEDDCIFLRGGKLENIPKDWDMLYLGGNLDVILNSNNNSWIKGCIWTTHSYGINETLYDKVINDLETYAKEVDRYYIEKIHLKYNCYLIKDFITTQAIGYSDIENRIVNYNIDSIHDTEKIKFPEHEIIDTVIKNTNNNLENHSSFRLKLHYPEKDLPHISIITPTRNRLKLFKIWIDNYNRIDYPFHKMEFIIVDDGIESLTDILPKDKRIKYIKVKTENDIPLPIGTKRNLCVKYSSYKIIIHMDDDDYYPSYSVKTRVKILMQNPEIGCVGCTQIGCYNILNNTGWSVSHIGKTDMSEASMAYTHKFYQQRRYDDRIENGESKYFLRGRLKEALQIPFIFIIIAINHGGNMTGNLRTNLDAKYLQSYLYYDNFPISLKNILFEISGNNKVNNNN